MTDKKEMIFHLIIKDLVSKNTTFLNEWCPFLLVTAKENGITNN